MFVLAKRSYGLMREPEHHCLHTSFPYGVQNFLYGLFDLDFEHTPLSKENDTTKDWLGSNFFAEYLVYLYKRGKPLYKWYRWLSSDGGYKLVYMCMCVKFM